MKSLIVLIFSFALVNSSYASVDSNKKTNAKPSTLIIQKSLESSKLINFNYQKPSWLDKYPEIKGKVEKIIQKTKKEVTINAITFSKEFPKSALLPYELSVEELVSFKTEIPNVVSVRLKVSVYTGGAHRNHRYYTWNWHSKKKKFLYLKDLVKIEKFPLLVEKVKEKLAQIQKSSIDYSGAQTRKDFKIWNFKQKNLLILFPEYQIAPYSDGNFEVSIPFEGLSLDI